MVEKTLVLLQITRMPFHYMPYFEDSDVWGLNQLQKLPTEAKRGSPYLTKCEAMTRSRHLKFPLPKIKGKGTTTGICSVLSSRGKNLRRKWDC